MRTSPTAFRIVLNRTSQRNGLCRKRKYGHELGALAALYEAAANCARPLLARGDRKCAGVEGRDVALYTNHHGHRASWTSYSALGSSRGDIRTSSCTDGHAV